MKAFSGLGAHDTEQLLATIEASLEIGKRFQFYLWAQGALQRFIPHETLLCAHGDITGMRFKYEIFSSGLFDARAEREVGDPVEGVLPRLVERWLNKGCVPQLLVPEGGSRHARPESEQGRYDVGQVASHGPAEIRGEHGSFFAFVRLPGRPGEREAYLLELLMPYLHMALYRMLAGETGAKAGTAASGGLLSAREVQVLQWVKNGKTNDEIAQILSISAPTVKNHIQKILRKLNVSNRAQAVGKADSLRLLQQQA